MSVSSAAYFLIAHGSRDPRSRQGLEACAALVRQQLVQQPTSGLLWPYVGTGVLEFSSQPLSIQIVTFAQAVARDGISQVFLVPLFLSLGHHVTQDLPAAIAQAQAQLSLPISLTLCPILGLHPHISSLVQMTMAKQPCDRWILLAHGTHYPEGNQPFEAVAAQVGAAPALWSTEPSLDSQLQQVVTGFPQTVGIVPYFLFPGRIMGAIQARITDLKIHYPDLTLSLTQPLNPSVKMAQLLLEQCPTTVTA